MRKNLSPVKSPNKLTLFLVFFLLHLGSSGLAATGVIVARKGTAYSFKDIIRVSSVRTIAGREFLTGDYKGAKVTMVRSPMGKVNNAITTQILIGEFSADSIVSISPAGAIQGGLNIGDIVLADRVFQHDFGTVKPYGFIWGKAPDGKGWGEQGYGKHVDTLEMEGLKENCRRKVLKGIVVSGDQLIASQEKRAWLIRKFDATAVDMGAAAIVQVCFANGVPCKIIRIITDHADETARSDFENSLREEMKEPNFPTLFQALMDSTSSP